MDVALLRSSSRADGARLPGAGLHPLRAPSRAAFRGPVAAAVRGWKEALARWFSPAPSRPMSRYRALVGTRSHGSDGGAMRADWRSWSGALPVALLVVAGAAWTGVRGAAPPGDQDFTSLSIEELMEAEVTSVSKKAERLQDAPAAVYVITAEDIRRSGATSLPELLRMVPGLQVARTGAHTWEISARGFRYKMANKFLVLIDGRAVYSPVLGTVVWEEQDLALENIERIEVIRGPGATLWGTNAVNGVINVITKSADDTRGTLVRLHAGNEETLGVLLRRGGALGERGSWRVTLKGFRNDELVLGDGRSADDRWSGGLAGTRLDWKGRGGGRWTAQAQYRSQFQRRRMLAFLDHYPLIEQRTIGVETSSEWAMVTWRRDTASGGTWSCKAWVDREQAANYAQEIRRATVDGLLEYAGPRTGRHQLLWGLGARNNSYLFRGNNLVMAFHPPDQSDQIYSGYVQDDIVLGPGMAHVVLGTKVEYTSASGTEIQPQVRAWWRWSPAGMAWAAISRSARTPTWMERTVDELLDVQLAPLPGGGVIPLTYRLLGSPDARAEHLVAHELGFRWTPSREFSLDVSGYWNEYRGVTSFDASDPVFEPLPSPHLEITATFSNRSRMRFRGIDVVARWRPRDRVLYEAWWSWLEGRIVESPYVVSDEVLYERAMYLGVNPRHQLHLRASVDLPDGWEFDGSIHWTDRLETGPVASWTRFDLRVGWHSPTRDREWSLALRNVLGRHLEFRYAIDTIEPEPAWTEPAIVSRWTWHF